jgi:GNAT superfamily N-acetyltransferase
MVVIDTRIQSYLAFCCCPERSIVTCQGDGEQGIGGLLQSRTVDRAGNVHVDHSRCLAYLSHGCVCPHWGVMLGLLLGDDIQCLDYDAEKKTLTYFLGVMGNHEMNPEVVRDGAVKPDEIEGLRQAVGWDRNGAAYDKVLARHYTYYTVRDGSGLLVGYMSVLSDGIADAFLLDLIVHPEWQHRGIGERIIRRAISDMKNAGVQCVQVTFNEELEPFYAKCGFHIFKGGIIDFKNMKWDEKGNQQ